jgi:transposase
MVLSGEIYKTLRGAELFWKRWYFWASHSRLEPVRKVAKTLKTHLYGILNYFAHPITNAMTEGINSRIVGRRRFSWTQISGKEL